MTTEPVAELKSISQIAIDLELLRSVPNVLPFKDVDWQRYVAQVLIENIPLLKDITFCFVFDECYEEVRCLKIVTSQEDETRFSADDYRSLLEIVNTTYLDLFEDRYGDYRDPHGSIAIVKFKIIDSSGDDGFKGVMKYIHVDNVKRIVREYETDRQLIDFLAVCYLSFQSSVDRLEFTVAIDVSKYKLDYSQSGHVGTAALRWLRNKYSTLKEANYVTSLWKNQYDSYNYLSQCIQFDVSTVIPNVELFDHALEILSLVED